MKLVTVIGARPQFIKAAPISKALDVAGIPEILVHTGQHFDYEMSQVFFDELGIPSPKHNLCVSGGTHGAMTGKMLAKIEDVLIQEKPDRVIVYGDTNSTIAGALAAAKIHIPIAHIEAGLRSWNRRMPEEINRVLTDHLSDRLFCSSEVSAENLKAEGITDGVYIVGDIMADSQRLALEIVDSNPQRYLQPLKDLGLTEEDKFALVTLHRAENTDRPDRFGKLIAELNRINMPLVFPIHPRTRQALERDQLEMGDHVRCVEPFGYLSLTAILSRSNLVLTDSGGLQKEAYWCRVPCITLRDETEWIETVEEKWNRIAPTGFSDIANQQIVPPTINSNSTYGDGFSAKIIAEILASTM